MSVVLLRCGTAGSGGGLTLGQKAALHQSLGLERAPGCCCPGEEGSVRCPTAWLRHWPVPSGWTSPVAGERVAGWDGRLSGTAGGFGCLQSLRF